MKIQEDVESGYMDKLDGPGYVGSRMTDVEVLRISGAYVIARGRRYGRHWLLKGLREDLRESSAMRFRLMKEFEVHSRLTHPNVAQAMGFEYVEGFGECIVEEWIEGKTLHDFLRNGKLTRRDRRRLMEEIISAVAYLHTRGVVHRDLKPSNVMVRDAGGEAVIIDFGLADTNDYAELKQPAGTVGFISPEQKELGGAHPSDDVFSLGVIMSGLYPEYSSLMRKCTDTRERRPRDAGELQKIFDRRKRLPKIAALSGLIILLAAMGLVAGWEMMKMRQLANSAENKVAILAAANERHGYRVTELRDSLGMVKSEMDETSRKLDEVEKMRCLKDSASKGLREEVEKILKRYDRYIISSVTSENPEALSMATTRLMDELRDVTERYCVRLRNAGLPEQELTGFNSEMTYHYHAEFSKYQQKWLKKIYPGWKQED